MSVLTRAVARILDVIFPQPPDDLMAIAEAHGVAMLSEAEVRAVIAAARVRSERAVALHPAIASCLTDEALADVLTEWGAGHE
jgi:Glu-tRNA(Gln) amidotransferase subunit E-like FAD-binding protein